MSPAKRAAVVKRVAGRKTSSRKTSSRKTASRKTSGRRSCRGRSGRFTSCGRARRSSSGPSYYVASGSSHSPKILAGPFGSYYEASQALSPGSFVYLRRVV